MPHRGFPVDKKPNKYHQVARNRPMFRIELMDSLNRFLPYSITLELSSVAGSQQPWREAVNNFPSHIKTDVLPVIFLTIASYSQIKAKENERESIQLLLFLIELFAPVWEHEDGNDLNKMISYADQATELVNTCWHHDQKLKSCNYESLWKIAVMKQFTNGTTRIFSATILLKKMVCDMSSHDVETFSRLLRYPRTNSHTLNQLPQRYDNKTRVNLFYNENF